MAFCNKLSGLIRQTVSQSTAPAMLNSLRWMSSSRVFVGDLSWSTDEKKLRKAFSSFGNVTEATVVNNKRTGKSLGFGFVSFAHSESATAAAAAMNGKELDGRYIRVNVDLDKPEPGAPRSSDGFLDFGRPPP